MADDAAAARREARRRRILQNSQARLEKIAGKQLNGSQSEKVPEHEFQNGQVNKNDGTNVAGHSAEIDNPRYCLPNNVNIDRETRESTPVERLFKHIWEDESVSDLNVDDYDIGNRETSTREVELEEDSQGKKVISFATSLKLHFIILAIVVRLLYYLDLGYMFGETIFVPFFIMESTNLLVLKISKGSSLHTTGMLGAVLLLCGITPNIVNTLTEITNALSIIGADFAMYFVSFVLFHCAFEELS